MLFQQSKCLQSLGQCVDPEGQAGHADHDKDKPAPPQKSQLALTGSGWLWPVL